MERELFPFGFFLRSKCVRNHGCMALIVSRLEGAGTLLICDSLHFFSSLGPLLSPGSAMPRTSRV